MWGGPSRFTVKGVSVDELGYLETVLAVTGTIYTTYNPGFNPRLVGKLTPNTVELYLTQAAAEMRRQIQEAKDSGEFDGADGVNGQNGAPGTPAGFGTPTATAHSLNQDDTPTVSIAASGSDDAKVFAFDFGIPVSVGKNFTILGHYASLQALQTAVPNPEVGDAYSVGSSTPYNVYIFDGPTGAWANYGTIGSGGGVVDTEMSESSTNAVQNNVIKAYVDESISDAIGALPAYQEQHIALTLTLDSDDWSNGSQAVTASGVTSFNTVIVSPAPSGISAYTSCGVYCSEQSANSLTFSCAETPDNDITVNVVVMGVIE